VSLACPAIHRTARVVPARIGFGLVTFIVSVGFQFDRLFAEKTPTGSLAGWPLALLILGALGLVVAALRGSET
jgi:hypothetical protein